MGVATQYDMTAATAVAAVGTALGHIFGPVEVARAGAALARAAQYLYIVDEIGVCHRWGFYGYNGVAPG